jgi:purine-binding chemotaxis protein CheW
VGHAPISQGISAAGTGEGDRDGARGEPKKLQFVGFRLDNEEYAIPITKIQEIILMKPITRLPQVPASIEGLINLRGSVLPIINLRRLFNLEPREFDDETRTIIVNVGERTLGYVVDEVTQVIKIAADQIQPTPATLIAVAKHHLAGLARLEDRLLIILDLDKLLLPEELEAATS